LFLEAGNCKQVVTKLALVSDLAQESDRLHIGGVIDRDHWGARQVQRFGEQAPVHVLGVHEIENLFLAPAALSIFTERNGHPPEQAAEHLRDVSDHFAGHWIAQRAGLRHDIDLGSALRAQAGQLTWKLIHEDRDGTAETLSDAAELEDSEIRPKVREWLEKAIAEYSELRDSNALWKECSGKQVLGSLPPKLGIASREDMERQVVQLFESGQIETPSPLNELRGYIESISAA
jgi:hypothetical protein